MARPTGLPKTGGRKKGTPNRKTLCLEQAFRDLQIDIPSQLADLLPKLSPEKRADVLIDLMSFIYPKRKPVEIKPLEEEYELEFIDST